MRNNLTCTTPFSARAAFIFVLMVSFCSFVKLANAQTLYRTVAASKLNIVADSSIETNIIKSEGAYLIKDGQLDEIYKFKFVLPSAQLKALSSDNLIGDKKITFEQTRVMVLPIMGMVHFVGTIDMDGVRSAADFQLRFIVNSDQSITFKGTKLLKLSDLVKDLPQDELKLDIDFVLKNNKNDLVVLIAK